MNNKLLSALLNDYIRQRSSDDTLRLHTENINWDNFFKLAQKNNVIPFIYNQLKPLSEQFGIDARYISYMKNLIIHKSSDQVRMNMRLNQIIDAFETKQIEYYVLKGAILAELYPHPEYRYSCDIDIHIDKSQLEKSMRAFESIGFKYEPDQDSVSDYKFRTPENYFIELHIQLFSEFYEKHKNIFDNIDIRSEKNVMYQNISGRKIRTLSQNEFLIYLLCHVTKHFIGSGINIRYLMDISIYINKYKDILDFKYIMSILERLKIAECVLNFFHICINYLGMDEIPVKIQTPDETLIDVLLYDIIEKHLNYDPNKSFSENNYDKMYGRLRYYGEKKSVVINMIFPNVKSIKSEFAYAKHNKFLLPIAWIHRLFRHFFSIVKGAGIKGSVDKVKDNIDRIHLLEKLGLLR